MSWLSLLKVALQLALSLSNVVRERQLMNAGEAKATARSLAMIADRLKIGEDVVAEVEQMTESDIDKELQQ